VLLRIPALGLLARFAMRFATLLRAATACLAIVLAPVALADAQVDFEANLAVSLKITAGIRLPDRLVRNGTALESSSRFISARVTQRDILQSLIEDGRIAGPLAGWRIVGRTRNYEFLELNYFYFVKINLAFFRDPALPARSPFGRFSGRLKK
jgi:hypothetical protein